MVFEKISCGTAAPCTKKNLILTAAMYYGIHEVVLLDDAIAGGPAISDRRIS